ncbi:hypothetical protein NQ318_000453 [Aromia moschata]|uniref:Carboxylic ester hydrolase n=1 Tax=Aromia moschata TaxID=1265417 RepID=A0AAV8YWD0_9CUCU|nr:hypothetical protein NQ318_000453 [Aromia moschata]
MITEFYSRSDSTSGKMRIVTFHIAVLYITFIYVARSECLEDDSLLVETSSGVVQGASGNQLLERTDRCTGFGAYRTRNHLLLCQKKKWTGILDVSEDSVQCIHGSNKTEGSEDCLNLKIYTTTLPKEQKKLPVFVFIHGGAFIFGSPNFTVYKPDLLLDEDVVVVAPQYRLGLFGFLSTGDMVAPGNNGIKDLVLALKWVKENIEAFGGDPDNITVAGQSAGSALVSYLLQTNHTKGLFNRAIMHSGTSLCLWAYFRKSVEFAADVAEYLKLDVNGTQGLFDQLKLMDATELLKAQEEVLLEFLKDSNPRDGVIVGPVIEPEHEGAVFSGRSYQELLKGNFHRVPLIVGHTSLEAYLNDIPGILRFYLGQFDIFVSKLVPIDMYIENLIQSHMVGSTIKKEYFGNDMIALSDFKLMKYISDDQFERPVQQSVKLPTQTKLQCTIINFRTKELCTELLTEHGQVWDIQRI